MSNKPKFVPPFQGLVLECYWVSWINNTEFLLELAWLLLVWLPTLCFPLFSYLTDTTCVCSWEMISCQVDYHAHLSLMPSWAPTLFKPSWEIMTKMTMALITSTISALLPIRLVSWRRGWWNFIETTSTWHSVVWMSLSQISTNLKWFFSCAETFVQFRKRELNFFFFLVNFIHFININRFRHSGLQHIAKKKLCGLN